MKKSFATRPRLLRRRVLRRGLGLAVTLALLCAPVALADRHGEFTMPPPVRSAAPEPSVGHKVFDAAILRPLQLVQVVVSAVIFLPAYPVAWLFDAEDEVMEICITEPVERTFQRSLGEL